MRAELTSLQDGIKLQPPIVPSNGSSYSSGRHMASRYDDKDTPVGNSTANAHVQTATTTTTTTATTTTAIATATTTATIKKTMAKEQAQAQAQAQGKQHSSQEQTRFIKRYRTEVAASASSVLSTLATFPLDSVKTRMQTYKYNGFLDCVRHTYQAEKLRGFFRGESMCLFCFAATLTFAHNLCGFDSFVCVLTSILWHLGVTAPLASITLVRTVSFSIYQRSKYVYSAWLKRNFDIDVLGHVNTKGTYPNLISVACFGAAGATAGSCITLIACKFLATYIGRLWNT